MQFLTLLTTAAIALGAAATPTAGQDGGASPNVVYTCDDNYPPSYCPIKCAAGSPNINCNRSYVRENFASCLACGDFVLSDV